MKKSNLKEASNEKRNVLIVLLALCIVLLIFYYFYSSSNLTGNVALSSTSKPSTQMRQSCGSGINVISCQTGEFCCPKNKFSGTGNIKSGEVCCNLKTEDCSYSLLASMAFCAKKCDITKETPCGNGCCDLKTEVCAFQAGKQGGFCIPKNKQCEQYQTPCTNSVSNDVLACCNPGEKCVSKTIQGAVPGVSKVPLVGRIFKGNVIVWGCTANTCPEKNGKKYTICKSNPTSKLAGYNVCCADETEACEVQPNGMARCVPKCLLPPKVTAQLNPSKLISGVTTAYYIRGVVKDACNNKPVKGYLAIADGDGENYKTTDSRGAFNLGPYSAVTPSYYGGQRTRTVIILNPISYEQTTSTLSVCVQACNNKKICPVYDCVPAAEGEVVAEEDQCLVNGNYAGQKKVNIRSVADVVGTAPMCNNKYITAAM